MKKISIYDVVKELFYKIDGWCLQNTDLIAKKILPITIIFAAIGIIILLVRKKSE